MCSTSVWKTWRKKEKLLVTSHFSFSHSVSYPFWEFFTIFITFEISSVKTSSLEESRICCLRNNNYHTILTINNPKQEAFWKQYWERRKCCKAAFSLFPTMFSTLPKTNQNIWVTFIFTVCKYFWIWFSPKFCCFTLNQMTKFYTSPIRKTLQTTYYWTNWAFDGSVFDTMIRVLAQYKWNPGCTIFHLINTPGAMQNIDRWAFFLPNSQSKKSVQCRISLCFRDCLKEILIKLVEISIRFS